MAEVIMDSIDPEVPFKVLSNRTINWIKDWSKKLAEIMKLNTHEVVEDVLTNAIENGSSIQDIELTLKDMPQFDRSGRVPQPSQKCLPLPLPRSMNHMHNRRQ